VFDPLVRRLAVLSLHTSPLAQPGAGDSGGMNVYVRELVSALAQAGVTSDVYTRRWADDLPDVVDVEPGFRVVHVPAGPVGQPDPEARESPPARRCSIPWCADSLSSRCTRRRWRNRAPATVAA
jgi:Glycosyl transferase 4-like domain